MSGVTRLLLLPFAAITLLLVGCGVPIAPEAITATAVAEQQAGTGQTTAFVGGAGNDTARSLSSASLAVQDAPTQTGEPLATLPRPTDTPTPEVATGSTGADAASDAETPAPDDGSPATGEGDGTPDPEATADASETPAETPSPTATPEPTATPAPVVANVNEGFAQEFLSLLNAQRTGRGMGALTYNTTLSAGATQYAGYMGTAGFFGHNAPDGSTPASRIAASGYAGAWNGEALSAGQPAPQIALNALLASAPHAAILLDPRSVEVGIGYAYVEGSRYRSYWVIVTGIP